MSDPVVKTAARRMGGIFKCVAVLTVFAVIPAMRAIFPHAAHGWGDWLSGAGCRTGPGFTLATSLLVFAGAPRLVFFGLGGLWLGFSEGFGLAMLASLAGSFGNFIFMRWCGKEWLTGRLGGNTVVAKITGARPSIWAVCMARQLPLANGIVNAGLAASRVGAREFLLGSLIGFIPQGAAGALAGAGAAGASAGQSAAHWLAAVLVLAATAMAARGIHGRLAAQETGGHA